jgi:quercetin dioxygenase-like cupin family protein
MQGNSFNPDRGVLTLTKDLCTLLIVLFLLLTSFTNGRAEDKMASNKHPLSFGKDQTIIDLNKAVWEPLTSEGIPPGPEIAILRGNLAAGGGEALVRLPANYTFPNHSHTSDELYVWLKGDFTYIAEDGTTTELSGQTYISLPGGVPHALKCGKEPCVFYLRYSRPFDYHIHPMPASKK